MLCCLTYYRNPAAYMQIWCSLLVESCVFCIMSYSWMVMNRRCIHRTVWDGTRFKTQQAEGIWKVCANIVFDNPRKIGFFITGLNKVLGYWLASIAYNKVFKFFAVMINRKLVVLYPGFDADLLYIVLVSKHLFTGKTTVYYRRWSYPTFYRDI